MRIHLNKYRYLVRSKKTPPTSVHPKITPNPPLAHLNPAGPTIVPVYTPPACTAVIYEFQTKTPRYLVQLPHSIYATRIRKDLMHRCVIWQRDCMRQGTHHTKGRAEVRGTTRKFAPQKGGGRARVGSRRSPIFRGGGVVHGPKSRSHATELQVKVREAGVRSALAAKYAANQLILTTSMTESTILGGKTRSMLDILNRFYKPTTTKGLYATDKYRKYSSVLIVSNFGKHKIPQSLVRASNNLPNVKVISAMEINVFDILRFDFLVMDQHARKFLEWRLRQA